MPNFAADVVDRLAEDPELVALEWHDERQGDMSRLTFRDFSIRSSKAANMLRAAGVSAGDRVLVMLPLCIEWWEAILGCMKAGAIPALSMEAGTRQDIVNQIKGAEATALIVGTELAGLIEELQPETPQLRHRILVGWERDGWTDYDRRVSLSSVLFEAVQALPDAPCLMVFSDNTRDPPTLYTHGDNRFDLEFLDAWRDAMMLTIRNGN